MNQKHNKEEVLKKGLNLFCSKGYNGIGMEEICTKTGMTKGAFYHTFKSKENYLIESIRLYSENNIKRIQLQLQKDNRKKAIIQLEQFYINMLTAQPKNNYIGCFVNNMMSEIGFNNEMVGSITSLAFDDFVKAIEPTLKEAQKEGSISQKLNTKKTAILIHSTFYGLLTIAKSSKDIKSSIQTIKLLFNNLKNQ